MFVKTRLWQILPFLFLTDQSWRAIELGERYVLFIDLEQAILRWTLYIDNWTYLRSSSRSNERLIG